MALTVTAADVRPLPGAQCRRFIAGATLTPGQWVYLDSNATLQLADADAEASSVVLGVVVASGPNNASQVSIAAGETCDVCWSGPVTGWSGMTPGTYAWLSLTAGAAEAASVASTGDFIEILGKIISATEILVMPFTTDVAAQ